MKWGDTEEVVGSKDVLRSGPSANGIKTWRPEGHFKCLDALGKMRLDRFRVYCFDHTRHLHWLMNVDENALFEEWILSH